MNFCNEKNKPLTSKDFRINSKIQIMRSGIYGLSCIDNFKSLEKI